MKCTRDQATTSNVGSLRSFICAVHKIRFRHYINRWVQRNFGLRSKKLQIQTFLQPYFGPKEFTIGSESKVWKYDAAPTWDHFPAKFQQCLLIPVWDTKIQPWVQSWVPKISVHNVVFSFGLQVSWTWTQKVTPPYVVASLHFVHKIKSSHYIKRWVTTKLHLWNVQVVSNRVMT